MYLIFYRFLGCEILFPNVSRYGFRAILKSPPHIRIPKESVTALSSICLLTSMSELRGMYTLYNVKKLLSIFPLIRMYLPCLSLPEAMCLFLSFAEITMAATPLCLELLEKGKACLSLFL